MEDFGERDQVIVTMEEPNKFEPLDYWNPDPLMPPFEAKDSGSWGLSFFMVVVVAVLSYLPYAFAVEKKRRSFIMFNDSSFVYDYIMEEAVKIVRAGASEWNPAKPTILRTVGVPLTENYIDFVSSITESRAKWLGDRRPLGINIVHFSQRYHDQNTNVLLTRTRTRLDDFIEHQDTS